jgi:hypothetical protein
MARIDDGAASETIPARTRDHRIQAAPRKWLFAAVVIGVGFASLLWYVLRPSPQLRVSEFTQITHDGRHMIPLGTDGARIYLNVYPDKDPPAQVPISGGDITRIPMPLTDPFLTDVSPDGSKLLVLSNFSRQGGIWSVQALGTSLRHLTDGEIQSAAWSNDGKSVVFATSNGDVDVMRSDGTDAHRLANLPYHVNNFYFERLAWSPDGKSIRFDRNNRIYEIKPDGSELHLFLPRWRPASALCCGQWTPDGRFFLFLSFDPSLSTDVNLQPKSQLWAFFEHRGLFQRDQEPIQLTSGPTRWGRPIPAWDGKKIFAMGAAQNGELVRSDATAHQLKPYLGGISSEIFLAGFELLTFVLNGGASPCLSEEIWETKVGPQIPSEPLHAGGVLCRTNIWFRALKLGACQKIRRMDRFRYCCTDRLPRGTIAHCFKRRVLRHRRARKPAMEHRCSRTDEANPGPGSHPVPS